MDKRKLKIALSLAVLIPCVLYAAGIIAQFIININAWKSAGSDYQIINRADVGGQYLNEWQTAKTTWVTTVRRFNTTPLPKTGY